MSPMPMWSSHWYEKTVWYSQAGGTADKYKNGNAITKDGMDGSRRFSARTKTKRTPLVDESCGSLSAKGDPSKSHAGAIGGTYWVAINPGYKAHRDRVCQLYASKEANYRGTCRSTLSRIERPAGHRKRGGYTKISDLAERNCCGDLVWLRYRFRDGHKGRRIRSWEER